MRLHLTALCGDTYEGAEMARKVKAAYIEQEIALGHMARIEGKLIVTVAGCNAYQAEWDAEYASTVTTSNNARLVNNLVGFKR